MLAAQLERRSEPGLQQKLLRRYPADLDRVPRKLNWLSLNLPDLRLAREQMERKDRMDAASAHPHLVAEPQASQALAEPASHYRSSLLEGPVPALFQSERPLLPDRLCVAVREQPVAYPLLALH